MLTLAHELIHAKQFIKGELSPTCRNWKTHNYTGASHTHDNHGN